MPAPTIDEAIAALHRLPPDRQDELASYIFHLATEDSALEAVDPDDVASVNEGLEQANRRQFASPERVAEVLGRSSK